MIFEKTKAILSQFLGIEESAITMETTMADLGVDSLDYLDFVMDLEDAFSINISEKETGSTVGDMVRYLESRSPDLVAVAQAELKQSA